MYGDVIPCLKLRLSGGLSKWLRLIAPLAAVKGLGSTEYAPVIKPGSELGSAPANAGCVGLNGITTPPCLRLSVKASCSDDSAAKLRRNWLAACSPLIPPIGGVGIMGDGRDGVEGAGATSVFSIRECMENSTAFLEGTTDRLAALCMLLTLVTALYTITN